MVAIGGFIAASEVSANYDQSKQDCIERLGADNDVAICQENLGRDESGALETLAYFGVIGTLLGGLRLFNND